MTMDILTQKLNAPDRRERIEALSELKRRGEGAPAPDRRGFTNNHVHTKYSFSPYSPAMAVWMAYRSGLETVGIIDHDTVNGAEEFAEAGSILGIATTAGFEMRTDWSGTRLAGRRINNPDQLTSAYICAHGLARTQLERADALLKTVRRSRGRRERLMTERINAIFGGWDIALDYDADVLPCSYAAHGGEVTERHLLYALALKMERRLGRGEALARFVTRQLGIALSAKQQGYLADAHSDVYAYDLLNILKGAFMPRIYADAGKDEMPPVADAVKWIRSLGAIPTYCYLGDVKASPTGDKKEQKFEDDYLDDVFAECRELGFEAVAFMPSRNSRAQLKKVMALCGRYGFMQISGEDINQPRQSFICAELGEAMFAHLGDAAWALIGHEASAAESLQNGIFAGQAAESPQALRERIRRYQQIGRRAAAREQGAGPPDTRY